jgi:hypothetical protein
MYVKWAGSINYKEIESEGERKIMVEALKEMG